jgi:hypothetical protein
VSPTAALNGLSVPAGDPQILLAPDPGPSPDARAFGEQLRDASAVSLPPSLSGTGIQKKDAGLTDWNGLLLPGMIQTPKVNQVTLPLNFGLSANRADQQPEQPVPDASPDSPAFTHASLAPAPPQQPHIEPEPIPEPASQTSNSSLLASPSASVVLPKEMDRSLTVTAQYEGSFQSRDRKGAVAVQEPVKGAKSDAPVVARPATVETQPPAETDVVTQPAAPAPLPVASQPKPEMPIVAVPETSLPVAAGTLPQPSQVEKTPVQPLSGGAARPRETAAPKDEPQEVSPTQANWVPPAIPRPETPVPSLGIAPSSRANQGTESTANLPQYNSRPAQASAPDPHQTQAQPETTQQTVSAPVVQPLSGELAFAVKVTPQETAGPATDSGDDVKPLVTSSAAQVAPVKESRRAEDDGTLADGAPQQNAGHETPLPAAALPLAERPAVSPVSVPEAHTATPQHPNSAEVAQLSETPEAKPPQPLKQLSIQMGQEPQQKVEVRVVERAGELQVAVRAANPDMAQGLRQGISDLVGQLEQSGYRADAWRPGTTAGTAPAAAEKPQTQAESQNNNSQSQSGWSQQDRQQGNHNPSRRPQWVEELETTSPGSGERIAGESYGISR